MRKIIICFLCLFLIGCDAKELSELSIGTVLGIDKKENTYTVSCLIVGKEENETKFYQGIGSSVETALNNLNLKLSENLYLNHIQSVIVGEGAAKDGMKNIVQYFIRNSNIQKNFYLFVTQDVNANTVLDNLLKTSGNDYNIITNIFKYNDQIDFKEQKNSFTGFLDDILSPNKEPVLHAITLTKDTLVTADLALFKNDKLISFSKNITGYAVLMEEAKKITLEIPCKEDKSIVSVEKIKRKTKVKNGTIYNTIKGNLYLKENGCHFKINTEKEKNALKKKAEKQLEQKLGQVLKEAKKIDSDIFGYQEFLYKRGQKTKETTFSNIKVSNDSNLSIKTLKVGGEYHE
ncbi:MAG: Ger(x)C family spore germination protein [Bacilli bacterium]|nr:Ger(x)C family spore germination protein [Bacilli bacterium]